MAGDWIKVERATLHKPEVLEAAELLGMDRRKALGLFLDYFAWLDENMPDSRNGFVTHVSRKSVDEALHEPGFAAVLERIGWAKFDDAARILTVINHERHNGSTAKTRASAKDRQQRFRNANVTPDPLPEKRREEKRLKPKRLVVAQSARPATATRLPEDWKLPPEWKEWTLQARPDWTPEGVVRLSVAFRDFWIAKAGKDAGKLNWLATWRTWVRRTETEPTR